MASKQKRQYLAISLLWATMFVVTVCTSQEQSAPASRDSVIAAAREMIGEQHYCALITVDSSGQPQVRTMNPFPPEDDMTVWIATNSRSRKVSEIRNTPRVTLYYADHSKANGYVAIAGKAVLVDDMSEKQKRKRAYWEQSFPDWKYLILIKVVPERIDVLNYKHHMTGDTVTWKTPTVDLNGK
jgi:general stress protein 26